jgi:competence protein ComEA
MAEDEKKGEPAEAWLTGWRKIACWLVGAALLAVVGYRGALGSSMAGAAPLPDAQPPLPAATSSAASTAPVAVASPSIAPPAATAVSPPATASPSDHAATAAPSGTAAAGVTPAITPDGKIILNLANEVELRKLPGIGRSRAQSILEQRERMGRFRRLEDLLRVKGIGRRRLEALRSKVVLDPL